MKDIYQHFRVEERNTIDLFYSKFEICERDYYPILLDFTDPRERRIINNISGHFPSINVHYYGGNGERERQRALLLPELLKFQLEDFEITVFEVNYPKKFVTFNHRNVLGAIMNVGVDRSLIGDIVVGDRIQFAICRPYAPLFKESLTKIKDAKITLKEVSPQKFIESKEYGVVQNILVSSFRLDTIISEVINEGRKLSKKRVESSKVKVNHGIVTEPSMTIEMGDTISVRHFGRFKVEALTHETKKGKYRLDVRIFKEQK